MKKTVDFFKNRWYNTYLHRRTVLKSTIRSEEVFGLPNIKSAKKRVQVSGVRNERNKADKSALKTALKKFEAAAAEGNRTEAEGAYKVAVKSIDKAAAKGLLHKNNAAHKKSALTLKLNQIG